MAERYNPYFKPGHLEVFCGPMNCGKSRGILNIIDQLNYIEKYPHLLAKSKVDTRDRGLKTRFGNLELDCHLIGNPAELFSLIKKDHCVIAIDEAQFFDETIVPVLEELTRRELYVLVGGLDLNFRGEPFRHMHQIMAIATEVHKLKSICGYREKGEKCGALAIRTQRLINGEPAHYDSPEIVIGDVAEGYFPRCLKHHFVPGKPKLQNL